MPKLDETDNKILKELLNNSRQSVKEIAAKVNLSVSPVHERIKKLEHNGIIKGYTAILDHQKMDLGILVFMQITMLKNHGEAFEETKNAILNIEEVLEGYFIAGEYDVLLKVLLRDMDHYNNLIINKLSKISLIGNIRSNFVMRTITENQHLLRDKNLKF